MEEIGWSIALFIPLYFLIGAGIFLLLTRIFNITGGKDYENAVLAFFIIWPIGILLLTISIIIATINYFKSKGKDGK